MSTAGKVLSVLVTLSMILWIVMAASVAQLNRNGNAAVAKNAEAIANLEESLRTTRADLGKLRSDTLLEQELTGRDVTQVRIRLAETERRLADVTENLERLNVQVAIAEQAVETAEANRDDRLKVREETQTELAQNRADVETLMGEEAELRGRKSELLDRLNMVLAENKELREKAASKSDSGEAESRRPSARR